MSVPLWSFIAAHGVLELPAIFIAGGAGLRLARALLFPGMLSRRDSLAVGGTEAVRLLVGVIPMLIVAGTIEAFFSPSSVPAHLSPPNRFDRLTARFLANQIGCLQT